MPETRPGYGSIPIVTVVLETFANCTSSTEPELRALPDHNDELRDNYEEWGIFAGE